MELRDLGATGLRVSPLGLGTVKIGRNQQVKYPRPFDLPSDAQVSDLLALARELGVNLLDTAPAYGASQQRLGRLLPGPRTDWVIVSKAGEFFDHGGSRFDFSFDTTVRGVEQSLRTLNTDYLDAVLIHSDGDDLRILEQEGAADALESLKARGLIRAHGISSKTAAGGLRALERLDIVMAACRPGYEEQRPVLQRAAQLGKGVLVKKGLNSGRLQGPEGVRQALEFIFGQPGVSSVIVGTINPAHLTQNARLLDDVLSRL